MSSWRQLPNPADEILPGLWLGNARAAQDLEFLQKNRIRAIFNFTKEVPFNESIPMKYRIPVDDNLQPEEIRNMELFSAKFVPQILAEWERGPVLLHCHAGMQRSAAAAAMTMIALGYPSDMSMNFIRLRRPVAFTPAPNFLAAIKGFERENNAQRYKKAMASL